jgi:hypothetical protein
MKALSLESGSATLRSSQFWLAGVRTALAIGVATSIPATTHADENGVSFWLPGLFGSLAAVPQQPGWALTVINYYDSVERAVPSLRRAKSPLGGSARR